MDIVDTTFLIDILRNNKNVQNVLNSKRILLTTQINMYEVIRGLFLRPISETKRAKALELFDAIRVLPLDENAVSKAAELSAGLMQKGMTVADCDCLTAGIALSKGISTIITNNKKHFERMPGITVKTY
jgi:predicted nucleic acid-binding protein